MRMLSAVSNLFRNRWDLIRSRGGTNRPQGLIRSPEAIRRGIAFLPPCPVVIGGNQGGGGACGVPLDQADTEQWTRFLILSALEGAPVESNTSQSTVHWDVGMPH